MKIILKSGKTATAINVYNALYNYTSGWNIFLLIKASLKGTWFDELKSWLTEQEYDDRLKNITFISYDAPNADRQFMDAIKNVDNSKKSMYIIDEAHNFIRNVYSNVSTGTGKRAQTIYDYIIQDKKENPDTRVLLITGTPAINVPYELALMFNMLRPGIFPKSESEFNRIFISTGAYQTLHPASKNMFQRRIMGLVSYYIGATPDLYASQSTHYIDVKMSPYQEDVYNHFESEEAKLALRSKLAGKGGSPTYKVYTRQACNFVFPAISQKVNGELRPRPGKFRLSEKEALKLSETTGVKSTEQSKLVHVDAYLEAMHLFMSTFDNYLSEQDKKDRENKHTIMDDINTFLNKYKANYDEFMEKEKEKSNLFNAMYTSSPKMIQILFRIMNSRGPVIVYSNYVLMEGLELFKIYLKRIGFYSFMKDEALMKEYKKVKEMKHNKDPTFKQSYNEFYKHLEQRSESGIGYVEFHGGIKTMEERQIGKEVFNMPENKHGEYIKIMLISPAGSEGLSLRNVRQVHIMEPYWNEVRITQMIGRGVRQCSHKDLPMEERHVDIYRYRIARRNSDKQTTDQYIEDLARSKSGLIESFLDAMKEAAVDCNLFKAHNMISQQYKCFQFDEPSLFDEHIGPAYREDIGDDMKMNNGLNSVNSTVERIKVMKIKAVMLISHPSEPEKRYSKPTFYWYYKNTGVVYDYDLYFAVGKVSNDENGIPTKLDKDTYIIDYVIPIPQITE